MFYLILFLLTSNIIIAQDSLKNEIIDNAFNNLLIENGSIIEFDYVFNNQFDIEQTQTIKCSLSIFPTKKYLIKIESLDIQIIYNNETIYTILDKEEEIHIEKNNNYINSDIIFLLKEYKNYYKTQIIEKTSKNITFNMIPKQGYIKEIFNNCIEELALPICLKLPLQCKLGISSLDKIKLEECLHKNNGIIPDKLNRFKLIINTNTYNILSIIQINDSNQQVMININNIAPLNHSEEILDITHNMYKKYEVIDLR
tara:strand:+ start:169 stop:936 length:768 start_codon:yes stop_codon:yes gene_type:complete